MTTNQPSDRSSRLEQHLKRSQGQLDEFEADNNLPCIPNGNSIIDPYFNMDRTRLEQLSREDCANIAYELAQYSYWVQKTINRENSKLSWAEAALNSHIGKEGCKYRTDKFMSYEELKYVVVANDSYAGALYAQKMEAKLKVDRLFFLSGKVEYMSKVMKDLKSRKDD